MGVDFSELTNLVKKLENSKTELKEEFEDINVNVASKFLSTVKKNTKDFKHSTGFLKRSWYMDTSKGKQKIDVINSANYAEYVEYGHRTRDHKNWVEGRWFMTNTASYIEKTAPKYIAKRLKNKLEEVINGK